MMTWLSVVAVGTVLFLGRSLHRRLAAGRLDAMVQQRRASSLVATRGELVDGNRHVPVAMALTNRTLHYENRDMEASLELDWVGEVEYDTRVGTGAAIGEGTVLRLRCYSQSFEFLLPLDALAQWREKLPAGRGLATAPRDVPLRAAVAG